MSFLYRLGHASCALFPSQYLTDTLHGTYILTERYQMCRCAFCAMITITNHDFNRFIGYTSNYTCTDLVFRDSHAVFLYLAVSCFFSLHSIYVVPHSHLITKNMKSSRFHVNEKKCTHSRQRTKNVPCVIAIQWQSYNWAHNLCKFYQNFVRMYECCEMLHILCIVHKYAKRMILYNSRFSWRRICRCFK